MDQTIEHLEARITELEVEESSLQTVLEAVADDMAAFHAPSECYALACGDRWDRLDALQEERRQIADRLKEMTGFEYFWHLCEHDEPDVHCQDCLMEDIASMYEDERWSA